MKKNGFLIIGKIIGTHGVKGIVKVRSYAESLSVFKPSSLIIVRSIKGLEKVYSIKWAKPHQRVILLSLKEINNLNLAEELIGSELIIKQSKLPELEKGTYYWFDIMGLSVFTNEKKYLGIVESIIPTGSNDVYVVKDPDKDPDHEILIPALESVVLDIDLKQKIMRVALPEGL